MKMLLIKRDGKLLPADDESWQHMARLPNNVQVWAEVKRARNPKMHRLFFALVKIVWDNSPYERYPTMDAMRAAIQVSAGHRDEIHLPGGQLAYIPKSISFGSMSQDEFEIFYQNVCDCIARHFLPGVTVEELRQQVEEMIGARIAA